MALPMLYALPNSAKRVSFADLKRPIIHPILTPRELGAPSRLIMRGRGSAQKPFR